MDITGGAEKTSIEGKHLAAVLAPTIRAERVPKDVVHLQKLLNDGKGKSVFEVKVAPKEDADVFVNFTEMRQMIETEDKSSDRYKELSQKLTIYEKILNGKVDQLGMDKDGRAGDPGERLEVLKVLGEIPGFAESIAIATGGSMTFEQATKYLQTGRGSIPVEHRKAVGEMISRYIGDPDLRIRLERSLGALKLPDEDLETQQELEKQRNEAKGKDILVQKRVDLESIISEYKSLSSDERNAAVNIESAFSSYLQRLPAEYKMAIPDTGLVNGYLASIESLITDKNSELIDLQGDIDKATSSAEKAKSDIGISTLRTQKDNAKRELAALKATELNLKKINEILVDPVSAKLVKIQKAYNTADAAIEQVNSDISKKEIAERKAKDLESKRNTYADKYKRKLERSLSDEMKRFWNEVKVEEAAQAGAEEAAEKKMLEEKAKTDAEKRAAKAQEMLDHYLHLSFMKYKGGKEVGFDDKAIKNFMHKDMLSQSPAQLARTFMERIDSVSGSMPPKYQEEIEVLFKEMREIGVAKGEPPLSFDKMLDSISQKEYFDLATKKVPDMLGYAWARGYYFDRMKLKKHEGIFLQEAYGKNIDFFKAALAGRDEQLALAKKLIDEKILAGIITPEQIEGLIGKDWTAGAGKLMKLLEVGAGAWFLGGGVGGMAQVGNIWNPSTYGAALKAGNAVAWKTFEQSVNAAGAVASTASLASAAAIQGITGVSKLVPVPTPAGQRQQYEHVTSGIQRLAELAQSGADGAHGLNALVEP